jgi:hypothetical protein
VKGAALTYARRYALFTLVGIAGEDDLDAPEIAVQPEQPRPEQSPVRKPTNGSPRPPQLLPDKSAQLRERLLQEISLLTKEEALALWAHRSLSLKNTLTLEDSLAVEAAYVLQLGTSRSGETTPDTPAPFEQGLLQESNRASADEQLLLRAKPVRRRSKPHLVFVASQPCLICKGSPCDPHHLKISGPRSLGRKVSDEFTVPLCRTHHDALHRHGNEASWWTNMQVEPLSIAKALWQRSLAQSAPNKVRDEPVTTVSTAPQASLGGPP